MIQEAIEYIVKLGRTANINVDGREYSWQKLTPILSPEPKPLYASTLGAIVDYIQLNRDQIKEEEVFVHVASPTFVGVYGALQEPWKQRNNYIVATRDLQSPFKFNQFYDNEQFIIELQSKFIQDETTAKILKIVGNIADETVKTVQDDGTTQAVHVETSIQNRKSEERIPNPVALRPLNTFPEIVPPEANFVLRLRSSETFPAVALFDVGDDEWKLETLLRIKEWFKDKLPGVNVIA